ncbi:MAG: hypothetical protein GY708_25960, partial [Actinomycetia bacterium]|nr:hypothetical protein [Actinomycetes bacterium]
MAFTEGAAAEVLDADVTISDPELDALNGGLGNYNGASLTLVRNGGASAEDVFTNSGLLSALTESGALVYNGTTIGTVTTNSGGTLVLSFNTNATSALVDSTLQSIAYSNSSDTPPVSAQIDWTFDDGNTAGSQGTGGALQATGSTTITITATNDDPTNAGSLPSDISVTEDVASNVDVSAIDLSDVDAAAGSLTVTFTTSTGGNLTATSGGGVTVGGSGTGVLTLDGSVADLNTFLNTASNVTYLHGTPGTNGNDADTIQINVNDNGNTGSGGGTNIDFGTVNVDIGAVNDAPINIVPGVQTIAEETTTGISGISIADSDAGGANLTTRLEVSAGVVNVTLSGSATISAGADGTGDLTIQGSVTDINATLASLTYTGNTEVVGTAADTLTVTTNDLGNTGSGGAQQDVDNIQIDLTAVNDAPTFLPAGPTSFTAHTITTAASGATSVTTADLDGDGDLDVLSASRADNKIAWYENDGSENFTAHTITTAADYPTSVTTADVDGDGDIDVLSASKGDNTVAWYENDGAGNFTAHIISTAAASAEEVTTADVDGDGDMDVLSASFDDDKIAWYENDGSENFTAHTITTAADGAYSVTTADVDGDGDMDVLSASFWDDKIAWYENDG